MIEEEPSFKSMGGTDFVLARPVIEEVMLWGASGDVDVSAFANRLREVAEPVRFAPFAGSLIFRQEWVLPSWVDVVIKRITIRSQTNPHTDTYYTLAMRAVTWCFDTESFAYNARHERSEAVLSALELGGLQAVNALVWDRQ